MISGESDPNVFEAYLLLEKREELSQFAIKRQSHRFHFGTVRSYAMSKDIVCRQTDAQEIRRRSTAQLFLPDKFFGEVELIIVGKRSLAHQIVKSESLSGSVHGGRSAVENRTICSLPLFI